MFQSLQSFSSCWTPHLLCFVLYWFYTYFNAVQLQWLGIALYLCVYAQSRPTLCNLMDCSPPGSSVHRSSPGKNTGVGCHVMAQALPSLQSFNFIFLFWKVSENMCLEAFGINWGQKTKFLPLISGEVKLNPRPWLPGSTFFHTGSDLRTKNNNRNGDYRCDHHQL